MATTESPAPARRAAPSTAAGTAAALGAYTLWGFSPAFWPLVAPAGAVETLAHRIAWTLVGMVGVLSARRRWAALRGLGVRTWALVTLGSVLIAVNWGVYIGAVQAGRVVEAALGYYANPLVSVLLGVVVLRERPRPLQWAALAVAAGAVVVLTVEAGTVPWISLVLATSFGCYGLVKKSVPLDPVPGLTAEGFLLGPLAIGFLVWLQVAGTGTFTGHGVPHALLLVAAGPLTAVPLLLFAAGARRLPLATLGVLQYLNPTLQFLWGVLVVGEAMPTSRWVGFTLVWLALVVFTADALRARRPAAAGQPTRATV